jgi:hypothetical protein
LWRHKIIQELYQSNTWSLQAVAVAVHKAVAVAQVVTGRQMDLLVN